MIDKGILPFNYNYPNGAESRLHDITGNYVTRFSNHKITEFNLIMEWKYYRFIIRKTGW